MRRLVAAMLGLAVLSFGASSATANDAIVKITCTGVTFEYVNFPDENNNTVNETVSVDGVQVVATSFSFNGPSGSITIPISVSPGSHNIAAHVDWNTNGVSGTFDANEDVSCGSPPRGPCTIIGSINSGFNGTAIVGVSSGPAFIWFNSNLKVNGMTAGGSIFLTNSTVLINGVPHGVPDAKITFAAVSCATTTFDTGTNTWNTIVPLAGSDEIFLSGLAFPVDNLPGGAKVSWQGTFETDQPGVCLSWKWGAAAYSKFTLLSSSPLVIDYNAARIKPTHQAACLMNNGDHAGTPQNPTVRSSVTGGARGGGGSNFTGSWSGTGSLCPVCPPTVAAGNKGDVTPLAPGVPAAGSATADELSFATPRPNPTFGPSTLRFAMPHDASISLKAYDVSGRLVRELATGTYSAGEHTLSWDLLDHDGRAVPGGIYFLRLVVEGRVLQQNLSVAR